MSHVMLNVRNVLFVFVFLNSFYYWVYRLGIAVLPSVPTTILSYTILWVDFYSSN